MDGVQLFGYDALNQTYDSELTALLTEIKRQGRVRIQGTETLIDGVSQGIVSDQARISEKLKKYLVDIKKQACENNKNVQYYKLTSTKRLERNTVCNVEKKEAKQNTYPPPNTKPRRL